MGKFLRILFCLVVVDFFFFSTTFSFSHGYNTKELLAVVGIVLFATELYRQKRLAVPKEFIGLLVYSGLISLMAVFTAVFHNTQERAYTTYFLSMLVWLSSAFVVVKCVKAVHGTISIDLIARYIITVAAIQGMIAVIADNYAPLDDFILRYVPGLGWCKNLNRLYGFGDTTTLDTGGIRFAIASFFCAHNIKTLVKKEKPLGIPLYILAFLIITITGNMVARTTIVGTAIGLAYLLFYITSFKESISSATLKAWLWLILETLVIVIIVVSLYNSNSKFYERTRFAFEGFFSLVEEGHWQTSSNDRLATMYVFPDNPETWLIGDGYFVNPAEDLNYLGEITDGYYKDTDVGYIRFIFFFGLLGLALFSSYIIYAGKNCIRLNPGNTFFFVILTSINFIIWLKVATDCFFILGLFICLGYVRSKMEETEGTDYIQE